MIQQKIRYTLLCGALMLTSSTLLAQTPATSTSPTTEQSNTENSLEKASYAYGILVGSSIKSELEKSSWGKTLDRKVLVRALSEALTQDSLLTSVQDASMTFNVYASQVEEIEREKRLQKGRDFLKQNGEKKEVKTTKSGVQYRVIKEGKGPKPTLEDSVKVHYKGRLIDGTEFDNSYKRSEPITISPLQVIPGWTEGLCLIPKGGIYELTIPSELAYGERGVGPIQSNSVLIFEVEMIDIIKGMPIPSISDQEKVSTPQKGAKDTAKSEKK